MSSPSILLVDDDRLILTTLANGLAQAGYDVTPVSDGAQAIAFAKGFSPDLAILDVRMPEMSGVEVANYFADEGIPFLALTAYGEKETVERMTDLGALGYLVKPIDIPQLVPAVAAALKRAADLKSLRHHQKHLSEALSADRYTSKATGVIMERFRMTSTDAFEHLRSVARSERRKLMDVAEEIVRAEDTINRLCVR